MDSLLPAALVIGGLWRTAPVHAVCTPLGRFATGPEFDAVYLHDGDGGTFANDHHGIRCVHTEGKKEAWQLELRLPGPLGAAEHCLERRVQERLAGVDEVPEWLQEATAAEASKRLVMLDALAASHGWPTGEGVRVYGWQRDHDGTWLLIDSGRRRVSIHADEGITDPMAALEATYRKVTHG